MNRSQSTTSMRTAAASAVLSVPLCMFCILFLARPVPIASLLPQTLIAR
eukprot:CAMPEP_0172404538 /NCGR_PEP_ID=MMETSP1061-20121228/63516_1 /TAXON_ID=37318 /ORGANISM="Pseudo-nitzschia pungens, Strain cf. pungens" /LENGTH=48 /DNA_ID= /DNA_START= /DNA_END= /DNA_ORIENTATION=